MRYASKTALTYIERHPGVCTAEVNRAARTARGGHRFMYATVDRLIARRLVVVHRRGYRGDLYATAQLGAALEGLRVLA